VADAHNLTPDAVLAWIRQIGGTPPRIIVLGCEPGTTEESMELSEPVANSIDLAIQMIRALISQMKVAPQCA
jgi:hydrogenase maturation protease